MIRKVLASLLFLILWGFYVMGAAPSVTSGDSAELSAAALTLGNAHSPGYPLFVLAGKLFSNFLPWGNPAYATNLFSAFCAALAFSIVFFAWKASVPGAIALLLAGMAPLIRSQSIVTEVFALNALMAAALFAVISTAAFSAPRRLVLAALFFGLGLANQQTLLLILPGLLAGVLLSRAVDRTTFDFIKRNAMRILAFLFAGLSLYVFLYLRSLREPLLDWEDPETFSRFWKVVTRARYGTLQLAQGVTSSKALGDLGLYARFFLESFMANATWAGLLFLSAGLFLSRGTDHIRLITKREIPAPVGYFLALFVAGPLFLWWAGVRPSDNTREMLERFLILPFFITLYFPIRGVQVFWEMRSRWGRILCAAGLVGWAALSVPALQARAELRWNSVTRDHGINVLRSLPVSATLFSDRADEIEFSLAYLLHAAKQRPDVTFVDCNAGVTKSQYGSDYYEIWGKPRLERRERVEKQVLANARAPVLYATVDPGQISIPRRHAGLLYEASENANFTALSRFPYWEVLLWRSMAGSVRDRHLILSNFGLMADYALEVDTPVVAARFYHNGLRFGHDSGLMKLANWYRVHRQFGDAEVIYHRLTKTPALSGSAWNNLGVLYADQKNWKRALECYQQALAQEPANPMAFYNIGVVQWQRGEWAAAEKAFREVVKLQPDHPAALKFAEEAARRSPPVRQEKK